MYPKRTKAEEIAERVARLHAEGLGRNAIARQLGCSPTTVSRAAEISGVSFDVAATAQAVKTVEINAVARRQEYVRRLYLLGEYATARLAKALANGEIDGRGLVTLVGVVSDKIGRLEPQIDPKAAEEEGAKQLLDELIDAINNAPEDEDAALAALAPGATLTSVLGPDYTPDTEETL